MLVVAEALGTSGAAQVMDLFPQSQAQPIYGIWENGKMSKVALFNWANDPSGGASYQFSFSVEGGVPSSVKVKYLLAPTLTSKDNITWAGQVGSSFLLEGGPDRLTWRNQTDVRLYVRVRRPVQGLAQRDNCELRHRRELVQHLRSRARLRARVP
jgi:hypothetical protein